VLDKKLKQRVIKEGLKPYLKDNRQAWDMNADGQYARKNPRGALPRSAQLTLLGELASE
jgi:polyphosphate kinase